MFSWFLFLLCEREIVLRERWLECMQSDRLIAAIKSQKYLEMFLEIELQVAFLQTGNDTWGFVVCFVFRRKKSGGARDKVARLYGE
jgi:hypothetical protein